MVVRAGAGVFRRIGCCDGECRVRFDIALRRRARGLVGLGIRNSSGRRDWLVAVAPGCTLDVARFARFPTGRATDDEAEWSAIAVPVAAAAARGDVLIVALAVYFRRARAGIHWERTRRRWRRVRVAVPPRRTGEMPRVIPSCALLAQRVAVRPFVWRPVLLAAATTRDVNTVAAARGAWRRARAWIVRLW